MVVDGPTDNETGIRVHDRSAVDLPFLGRVLGDIGDPQAVRRIDREAAGWQFDVELRALSKDGTGCEADGKLSFHSGQPLAMVA